MHPDYHLAGSNLDLAASLDAAASLNESYNTLRDPFRRAEYLLTLLGGPTAAEQKEMGQAFLLEMLEVREGIEDVRTRGDLATAERIRSELQARLDDLMQTVAERFETNADLRAIRRLLNEARYIQGLLRDLPD